MNKIRFQLLLGILLSLASSAVFSSSPVWEVSHGDRHLYLGGTVHVLSKSDYPLPLSFEEAYGQSDTLVFETDINQMQQPENQQILMKEAVYSDGKTLKTILQPETYLALEKHLEKRGISVSVVNNLKAGMASVTVTMLELQLLGLSGSGVDEYFNARALSDKKRLVALETVEQQLGFIVNLGNGYEDQLISYTLRDVTELPNLMKTLKQAWRSGDNQKLKELALTPMKDEFPEIYKTFFANRNKAWLKKIESMLDTPDVEFVLVGALHMVGKEGILEQLESLGYEVKNVTAEPPVPPSNLVK